MGIAEGSAGLVIRIQIQRLEPLLGTAVIDDGSPVGFEGWMELIGAVAELLGSPDHPCVGDRDNPDSPVGEGDEPS
jgi:hypothetical protein